MEIWKDIKDYEGYYQISNFGNVKSLTRLVGESSKKHYRIKGQPLKKFVNNYGYYQVTLCKNNKLKNYRVGCLVWDAFGDKPRNGLKLQVDHINGDKQDDRFSNLQLLTNRENCSKGFMQNGKKTSKYTGVSWDKKLKKWVTHIGNNGKYKHLGYFNNELEASKVYQKELLNLTPCTTKPGLPEVD